MLYRTISEYQAAIANTQQAITRLLLIGEENENNSGGSSRKMRDTDLKKLESFLSRLQKELDNLNGRNRGLTFTPGW
jgi:hypothetical protein